MAAQTFLAGKLAPFTGTQGHHRQSFRKDFKPFKRGNCMHASSGGGPKSDTKDEATADLGAHCSAKQLVKCCIVNSN